MLKKIDVQHLQLGMHLHSFAGAWADHPFWRTGFILRDEKDLDLARASTVTECWIDVSRGLDMPSPTALGDGQEGFEAAETPPPPGPAHGPAHVPMDEELRHAAQVCQAGAALVERMFGQARLGHAVDGDHCLPLVQEISASIERNPGALVNLARLKTQDDYSYMHSVAVCALMVALARQLGMSPEQTREAGLAGLLHDLGKAVIPAEILCKPGKLDDAEFDLVKTHAERGHALLLEGRAVPPDVLDVVLHHHERIDGKGYPHGLAGDSIGRLARMGAVCDVYDAITSERPYKAGWDPAEAIARMAGWQGHFDPVMLSALIRCVGIYPVGALVQLESRRIAVVVEHNEQALTRPRVKAFFSMRSGLPIRPVLVDLSRADCTDRIVGRDEGGAWNARDVAALWAGDALPNGYRGARRKPEGSGRPATFTTRSKR